MESFPLPYLAHSVTLAFRELPWAALTGVGPLHTQHVMGAKGEGPWGQTKSRKVPVSRRGVGKDGCRP